MQVAESALEPRSSKHPPRKGAFHSTSSAEKAVRAIFLDLVGVEVGGVFGAGSMQISIDTLSQSQSQGLRLLPHPLSHHHSGNLPLPSWTDSLPL